LSKLPTRTVEILPHAWRLRLAIKRPHEANQGA
jgi:hypothetical protein